MPYKLASVHVYSNQPLGISSLKILEVIFDKVLLDLLGLCSDVLLFNLLHGWPNLGLCLSVRSTRVFYYLYYTCADLSVRSIRVFYCLCVQVHCYSVRT